MNYLKITLKKERENDHENLFDAIKDLATAEFDCLGVEDFALEESEVDELLGDRSYCGGDVPEEIINEVIAKSSGEKLVLYFSIENSKAGQFLKYIDKNCPFLGVETEEFKDKDWNEEWKKHYKEIPITDKIKIVPSWEKGENKENDIYIYPGMGFGTGSHETTFLCLKTFFELEKKFNKILDFGCGSGILGIGALKLGLCDQCDLYDIESEAMVNSEQNLEINHLENGAELIYPNQKDKIGNDYDLVFANILLYVLKDEFSFITNTMKKGSTLIASGLLADQVDEFLEFYSSDFNHIKTEVKNHWAAVILERK